MYENVGYEFFFSFKTLKRWISILTSSPYGKLKISQITLLLQIRLVKAVLVQYTM